MNSHLLWVLVLVLVSGYLLLRAGRIWRDASRLGFSPADRLHLALKGTVRSSSAWWAARLAALPRREQDLLLARETDRLGLSRADALRCPLCDSEIPRAWTVSSDGEPAVAHGPVDCPSCDFRLDACRHCSHFLPGPHVTWGQFPVLAEDPSSGRCGCYHVSQPVEEACAPEVARRLKARGHDRLRAPRPILDSFFPPDSCRAFKAQRKRLRAGGISWPDARHTALLQLLAGTEPASRPPR
jgi:hypothetical protein